MTLSTSLTGDSMARKYIPLDSNFLDDPKIITLFMRHGSEGLLIWITTLCYLRESEFSRVSKTGFAEAIAFRLRLDMDTVENSLKTALLIGLIQDDDGWLYSQAFDARMELMNKGNAKRAETMRQRWEQKRANTPPAVVLPEPEPQPEQTKRPRIDHSADVKAVFDHWNSKKIAVHREVNPPMRETIIKAVGKYTLGGVLKAIDYYEKALADANNPMSYKWTLVEFLKREKGLACYYDKAVNLITEQDVKSQAVQKQDAERRAKAEADRKLIDQMSARQWHEFETLAELLKHLAEFPTPESMKAWRETFPPALETIVNAPECGIVARLKYGVPERLENEYRSIK